MVSRGKLTRVVTNGKGAIVVTDLVASHCLRCALNVGEVEHSFITTVKIQIFNSLYLQHSLCTYEATYSSVFFYHTYCFNMF